MISTDNPHPPSPVQTTPVSEPVNFDLAEYLSQRRTQVETALEASISVVYPEKIYEAMRYSLMAGGQAPASDFVFSHLRLGGRHR